MPKPGSTTIVVKESVRNRLQGLAEAQGYRSINQLLEDIITYGVNLEVHPKRPKKTNLLVGSPGFEPGSREPKSRSLDQASRRPPLEWSVTLKYEVFAFPKILFCPFQFYPLKPILVK